MTRRWRRSWLRVTHAPVQGPASLAGDPTGHGVIPDVDVGVERKSLLDGRDAQLERAIELIHSIPEPPAHMDLPHPDGVE